MVGLKNPTNFTRVFDFVTGIAIDLLLEIQSQSDFLKKPLSLLWEAFMPSHLNEKVRCCYPEGILYKKDRGARRKF